MSVFTDAFEQRLVNILLKKSEEEQQKLKSYDEVFPEPKENLVSKFLKVKESSLTASCAAYIYCDNHILAARRGDTAPAAPGKWNVPTGMIEAGEPANVAILREVDEETGLKLNQSQLQFLELQEWGDHIHNGANFKVTLEGTIDQHPTGPGDGECSRYEWIPLDEIDSYDWAFNMNEKIKRYSLI